MLFLILTFRKFIIIRQIVGQYEQDLKSTNYYGKTPNSEGGATETYIYGNIRILKHTSYSEDGLRESILYIDENTKQYYIINNSSGKKTVVNDEYKDDSFKVLASNANVYALFPSNNEPWRQFLSAIDVKIDSSKFGNKDCYHITFWDNTPVDIWVNKQDMRVIGERNLRTSDKDGNSIEHVENHFYKINELTQEDVKLPDLTGYVIQD